MNELKLIEQRKVLGKEFRIYGDFENPLFVAVDVAEWIEHSNTTEMLKGIDDDEKLTSIILRAGQRRAVAMLTEDGLYEVLMQSRKPIAKEFKREVKQILKTIRKHGLYAKEELLDNPDIAIAAFKALKEEREARKALEVENNAMKPKALFADAVSASHTSILIGELAKLIKQNGIDIGQKRLFEWLREQGFLMKSGSSKNMPTQRSMEQGLFEIKESSYINSEGVTVVTKTTKVTGKGQIYFTNKFLCK
ncbi:phage antirepressor Ant [Lachnoanaerobaculum orale]|uniref:Phage antirepressor Ant n=1 Tax=Lachnoanaerobaculum orale TaxID=979627 RepID=A0A3P3Q2M1_9FIRM|nr:phage antirepressor KilAC domain-containing protein [Lachnoanaerobaculum orale]RRJ15476.1 phage antirepressor Ant [Lachnoanaerobaculum orale]